MTLSDFKPLALADKAVFDRFFRDDPPQISEMTFTNLFMWRRYYRPMWLERQGCLNLLFQPQPGSIYGLAPVGIGDKAKALAVLCEDIGAVAGQIRVCRVADDFLSAWVDPSRYSGILDRDNSDYVYLTQDLIHLSGNKYHRKKNHLNQFTKKYDFTYRPLDSDLVERVMRMQESWCRMRECVFHPELLAEDFAVREALTHFGALGYRGGAILIDGRVEAFSLGEALNADTAVIHIEKANPEIHGLYTAINQVFCREAWSGFTYLNREQDKGVDGLRKAKQSYHPHHMVNKYTLTPTIYRLTGF